MKVNFKTIVSENAAYLKRKVFFPVYLLRGICIRAICFYQKHLSRRTCLYSPTCSEYTKRCINNWGVIVGILLGCWRILRCNPLSKGGVDEAPEVFWKRRWLI